jgi:hypothetical protein
VLQAKLPGKGLGDDSLLARPAVGSPLSFVCAFFLPRCVLSSSSSYSVAQKIHQGFTSLFRVLNSNSILLWLSISSLKTFDILVTSLSTVICSRDWKKGTSPSSSSSVFCGLFLFFKRPDPPLDFFESLGIVSRIFTWLTPFCLDSLQPIHCCNHGRGLLDPPVSWESSPKWYAGLYQPTLRARHPG